MITTLTLILGLVLILTAGVIVKVNHDTRKRLESHPRVVRLRPIARADYRRAMTRALSILTILCLIEFLLLWTQDLWLGMALVLLVAALLVLYLFVNQPTFRE